MRNVKKKKKRSDLHCGEETIEVAYPDIYIIGHPSEGEMNDR